MRLGKFGLALAATGALATLLSGCIVFKGTPKLKQKGSKPKAVLTFKLCLSDGDVGSECPDMGNSGYEPATDPWRVLVGLRLSKGAKAPNFIEPKSVDFDGESGTNATVLGKDASFTSELKNKAPGNSNKYKWVGYVSEPITIDNEAGFHSSAKFRIPIEVKDKLVGKKLKARPTLGSYQVSGIQPADDPIDCGSIFVGRTDPTDDYGPGDWAICIDSPSPDNFTNAKVKING